MWKNGVVPVYRVVNLKEEAERAEEEALMLEVNSTSKKPKNYTEKIWKKVNTPIELELFKKES
jgi:uncharacterized protein YifE (UPF0438 family)